MNRTTINEVLDKFEISEADLALVRAAAPQLQQELDAHVDHFYDWMSRHKEYKIFFASNQPRLERVKRMQRLHWISMFEARLDDAWFASRRHVGAVHAHIDLPNDIYFAAISFSGKSLIDRVTAKDSGYSRPAETASALLKLVFLDAYVVINEISRIQAEKLSASAHALMEMSTPVTPIWEGILLLPLIGFLDSSRTQEVMNKTLNRIAETRAKVFVLDISGVGAIDTAVANQLLKITKATQLMGARQSFRDCRRRLPARWSSWESMSARCARRRRCVTPSSWRFGLWVLIASSSAEPGFVVMNTHAQVTATRIADSIVVAVPEELSAERLQTVGQAVHQALASASLRALVFDMSALKYADSSEFRALLSLAHAAALLGVKPLLAGLSPGIIMHLAEAGIELGGARAFIDLAAALEFLGVAAARHASV